MCENLGEEARPLFPLSADAHGITPSYCVIVNVFIRQPKFLCIVHYVHVLVNRGRFYFYFVNCGFVPVVDGRPSETGCIRYIVPGSRWALLTMLCVGAADR